MHSQIEPVSRDVWSCRQSSQPDVYFHRSVCPLGIRNRKYSGNASIPGFGVQEALRVMAFSAGRTKLRTSEVKVSLLDPAK